MRSSRRTRLTKPPTSVRLRRLAKLMLDRWNRGKRQRTPRPSRRESLRGRPELLTIAKLKLIVIAKPDFATIAKPKLTATTNELTAVADSTLRVGFRRSGWPHRF